MLTPKEAEQRIKAILDKLEAARPGMTQKDRDNNTFAYEGELEIRYEVKNGVKHYTIACGKCGCNHLFMFDNLLRCKECYFGHSYAAFLKLQERIYKDIRFNGGKIQELRQPKHNKTPILVDAKTGRYAIIRGNTQKQREGFIKDIIAYGKRS